MPAVPRRVPLSVDLEATIDENCSEVLRPWRALDDDACLDTSRLDELADHTTALRAIRIVGADISLESIRTALKRPVVSALEVLLLPTCTLGEGCLAAICEAALPLRFLDLRQTAIGDDGARILAASPLASQLEHLSIAGSLLTTTGFQTLLDSPLGQRPLALHVEEEGQPESLIPTLMGRLFELADGDAAAATRAFARLLRHPSLTRESANELRYQWDLVMSN